MIVFPDQSATEISNGYAPARMPEEYTGGLGNRGAAALKEFAEAGGKLVFLNRSCDLCHEHARRECQERGGGRIEQGFLFARIAAQRETRSASPLTRGLPEDIAIWSEHSPAWKTSEEPVARYPPLRY